ncbi:SET domain-containing protein [Athelia psychrophila]|uniref:SET domain-containing protein n=1 Tax=Athelia psychrophila TaxID=1759441 RepID=A0A166RIY9_9AGAM|nr:SET domain-containing protein [Fibularhizoctonia sp. CBS 109695]
MGQKEIAYEDFSDNSQSQVKHISVDVIAVPEPPSLMHYESSTPASRSIFHGDDDNSMAFMPFPNDPKFDSLEHSLHYKTLSWQDKFDDPDVDLIMMETALQLNQHCSISFEEIDKTNILPHLMPRYGSSGLAHKIRQRDIPDCPVLKKLLEYLKAPPPRPYGPGLYSRLESIVSIFCPNLSCLQPYCTSHVESLPMAQPVIPQMHNDKFARRVKTPCGETCFVLNETAGLGTITWSAEDVETLTTVLLITPDTLPCDLAIICDKPCHEVFHQRGVILPPELINAANEQKSRRPLSRSLKFADFDPNNYTPNSPCSHEGPCDHRSQCDCYLNKAHCERNCRCSPKCHRRWKGCQCARSKIADTCSNVQRCACRKANRECDPDVCLKCKARDSSGEICHNVCIQQGRRKGLEVRESTWGLGAFLTEDVNAGELISEYIGELIYELTTDSRQDLSKHSGRNYVFALNSTVSIDSSYVGNETRFVNHVPAPNANSSPQVWLVNGEHRIGIFAAQDMKNGTEISFDYGPQFFVGVPEHGPAHSESLLSTTTFEPSNSIDT